MAGKCLRLDKKYQDELGASYNAKKVRMYSKNKTKNQTHTDGNVPKEYSSQLKELPKSKVGII